MSTQSPLISIVVPFFNEGKGIDGFYDELFATLDGITGYRFEVICVDDGSADDTLSRLIALSKRDGRVHPIELSRNFGKEAALTAGIDAASGSAVIPMDADLQDPPDLIPVLIAEWQKGAEVVLARRSARPTDTALKRISAQLFYRLHNKMSQVKIPENVGDFRLMDRSVVDALKQLPERNRFMKGLFAWVGFRTVTVDYVRRPRGAGTTKFSGWRLWNLALEGITGFTTLPLRLWTYLGACGAFVSAVYGAFIILRTVVFGIDVPGYASLLVVMLFVGSIQLIGIGILGEYVGRIYMESKQRPPYLIRRIYAAGGSPEPAGDDCSLISVVDANVPVIAGVDAENPKAIASPPLPSNVARVGTPAFVDSLRARSIRLSNHPLYSFVAIGVIVLTAWAYSAWLLNPKTFFYFDDWQWLWHSEFWPWTQFYSVLPRAAYNDRPVGFLVIKLMYGIFGLNHHRFQLVQLTIHAINCVLLYVISARYISRLGALVAAIVASIWFIALDAVGWTAAIFDLLGATFCLATIALRQLAARSNRGMFYDLAGAACYFLAIRTKEFALGMIVVLFLMNILLERQKPRSAVKQLLPYIVVFAVLALRYAHLFMTTMPAEGDPYHLQISLSAALSSIYFYISQSFYGDVIGKWGAALVLVGLTAAIALANEEQRRAAVFGFYSFIVLLGPTLLMPAHLDPLYLYAPHFFLSLVVGACVGARTLPGVLAIAVTLMLAIAPGWTRIRQNHINWVYAKGEVNQAQFEAAVKLLTPMAPGTSVFISGVEPFINSFHFPHGALQTAFKDESINTVLEKPVAELTSLFCAAAEPKRFIKFEGKTGTDATQDMQANCSR